MEATMRPKNESVATLAGCDPVVASGIDAFTNACTASYTTCSRRFSIWKLIRQNVELPLSNYLRAHGFLRYPECFGHTGLADALKSDAYAVEQRLRSYIRLSREETFQATLESVLHLVYFCKERIPYRSVRKNAQEKETPRTVRRKFEGMQYPYCELCWRLCQHAYRSFQLPEGARQSIRFCGEHDPKNSNSRYRADHNHREQFHTKLKEIYNELPYKRDKWIALAGDIDEPSIRRYAYMFVHSLSVDDRLEAMRLSSAGHTNVEIAERLGISRQMVHKFLNQPLKRAFGRTAQGNIYAKDQLDALADATKAAPVTV
jgi:hypothetical protein